MARERWSAVNQLGPNMSPGDPDNAGHAPDTTGPGDLQSKQIPERPQSGGRKTQVQGNRQGGGDQRGKSNRPRAGIPDPQRSDEEIREVAEQSRDARGARKGTLSAVGNTTEE